MLSYAIQVMGQSLLYILLKFTKKETYRVTGLDLVRGVAFMLWIYTTWEGSMVSHSHVLEKILAPY